MNRTFTQDDCLLFIYNELSPEDHQKFQLELASNPELNSHYLELKDTLNKINHLTSKASKSSIDLIMEFSAESNQHHELMS